MKNLKSLFIAASLSSLLAGVILTLVQQAQVIPLIETAEQIEKQQAHNHEHEHQQDHVWMPKDGMQRQLFTTFSNIVIALGFTLLLAAVVHLSQSKLNWKRGLLWGLAGYAVFFLAPALSMTPELPGMQSAALADRQLWWLATSACTAVALALLAFKSGWPVKAGALLLLLIPHWFGAPGAIIEQSGVSLELIQGFLLASVIANAVFWLAMGGFYGYFHKKWVTA